MKKEKFRPGCEVLVDNPPSWFRNGRLGLLANQASVTGSFQAVSEFLRSHGGNLTCLFSPQHGYHSEKQANMIESSDGRDSAAEVPVFSLYGSTREPTTEMLKEIDVLMVDLQDVGTRVYTYTTTVGLCLEAAARNGIKTAILDRPNPIGGNDVEGNIVSDDHRSFVGRYPVPMRHGLTMGEFARYVRRVCGIECDLEVVPMRGWRRDDYFPDLNRPWVYPSPNMPSWETAMVYPGMVLLEGVNISEGRGTTLPFQLFGAPFIDCAEVLRLVEPVALEGAVLRPVCFEPVFDKWAGRMCSGFQIHITDRNKFRPYRLGLSLLSALHEAHPNEFSWLPPPYEYEWEKLPIDILLGNSRLRRQIESGDSVSRMEAEWVSELSRFTELRKESLIYD